MSLRKRLMYGELLEGASAVSPTILLMCLGGCGTGKVQYIIERVAK